MKLRKRAEGPEGLHGLEDTEKEKQGCTVKKRTGEGPGMEESFGI